MIQFIATIADASIFIFLGLLVLYLHTKGKTPLLSSKKRAVIIAIFFFAFGGYRIYEGYRDYAKKRFPSPESLLEKFSSNGIVADKKIIYRSPDGYCVLIPQGYEYITMNNSVSLATRKNVSENEYAGMIICKLDWNGSCTELAEETLKSIKGKNPHYSFGGKSMRDFGKYKGVSYEIDIVKNGLPCKELIAFCKQGACVYQIVLFCTQDSFGLCKGEFEEILDSFRLK
jgi:hypothetical protein